MKSFDTFLSEAVISRAVEKAKRMGFVSDGHGNWYDRQGQYRGRTYHGDLVLSKGRGPGKEEPQQKKAEGPVQQMAQRRADDDLAGAPLQKKPEGEAKEKEGETLTVAFGRFNPPTKGHAKLLDAAKRQAAGGKYRIYPSRSEDPKKNPLNPDEKISYMRKMFPDHGERIVNDDDMKTIFDVLQKADEDGYGSVNIMVGADRQAEFEKLATKYNGELYDFSEIEVISAGERDSDAEGVEGVSASKLRKAAADGDFKKFSKGVPDALDSDDAQRLFNTVRKKMGLKDEKVTKESLWEIAPKLDWKGLRENYITEKIFKIGDMVENLNTGLIGRIIRRGTNHLICVAENNVMFKSWVRDLNEYSEKKADRIERVPGKPNTLDGSGGYRKLAMKMTGTKKIKNFNVEEFLNKYRKKS